MQIPCQLQEKFTMLNKPVSWMSGVVVLHGILNECLFASNRLWIHSFMLMSFDLSAVFRSRYFEWILWDSSCWFQWTSVGLPKVRCMNCGGFANGEWMNDRQISLRRCMNGGVVAFSAVQYGASPHLQKGACLRAFRIWRGFALEGCLLTVTVSFLQPLPALPHPHSS